MRTPNNDHDLSMSLPTSAGRLRALLDLADDDAEVRVQTGRASTRLLVGRGRPGRQIPDPDEDRQIGGPAEHRSGHGLALRPADSGPSED